MFGRTAFAVSLVVAMVACSKEAKQAPPSGGSATAGSGSGSALAGSGSGAADSGSGSGSGMGSDTAAGPSADSGSAAGSDVAAGSDAPVEFDKLSHEDKVKFMKTRVMPAMKPAFQKFDPKEFANFTCKTCHGKDPQKTKYEMPSADLPKLDFAALKAGEDAEIAKFMDEVVTPQMAKILGEPEMSKDQPDGFGCLECHTQKK